MLYVAALGWTASVVVLSALLVLTLATQSLVTAVRERRATPVPAPSRARRVQLRAAD